MGAEALAHKDYFAKEAVAKIKAGSGDIDLANDLVALAALYTGAWSTVSNKTTVEWAQVEEAAVVGPQLLLALGQKLSKTKTPTESEGVRNRAVSLFVDVYDELERAVGYLRWHEGDAKALLPSIYQGGAGRRAADADAETDVEVPPVAGPPAAPEVTVPE